MEVTFLGDKVADLAEMLTLFVASLVDLSIAAELASLFGEAIERLEVVVAAAFAGLADRLGANVLMVRGLGTIAETVIVGRVIGALYQNVN